MTSPTKKLLSCVVVLLALLLLASAADQRSQQQRQRLAAGGSAGGVDPASAGPPPQGALQLFRDYPMSFAFIATTMSMTERVRRNGVWRREGQLLVGVCGV